MRQIFIFTAAEKNARAHLQDSILNPVPFEWLESELGSMDSAYYRSLMPDGQGFYAWGAVPGSRNRPNWENMQMGDLVLTVYENQYHFLSSVIGKFNSQALARRIWGQDEKGNTWEYMYLLAPPQPISVGVVSEPVVSYLNKTYRGFAKISDAKVQAIIMAYGSLERFVQKVLQSEIPETHIDRDLKEASIEADATASFNPKDMVDGRKKVVQEIVRRQGQPKFRKELLKAYDGKCTVTGCDVEAVLEAAHIAPYFGKESNSIQNGLLLRADIHTLFDLGQLKITPDGRVQLHERLFGTLYEQYQGQKIRLPADKAHAPSKDALKLKHDQVL
jgi:hypothetical protein